MTVLLARNRRPPPTVAAGVPHTNLAAELISLPSGLLAMVSEAIVKLKVRLGAAGAHPCVSGRGRMRSARSNGSYWMLFTFPMCSEPAPGPIRSVRALCVGARD